MITGVILGSGATKPSAQRNPSGIYLKAQGETILLDCGQGTQRQLLRYACDFFVDYVILSHHHSDHVGGLAPYLQSMNLLHREKVLTIYSPEPKKVATILAGVRLNYPVDVRDCLAGVQYLHKDFSLKFYQACHGDIRARSVLIRSRKTYRRDRQKLLTLPPEVRKVLCNQGTVVYRGESLKLSQYLLPASPRYELYYSGDTQWIPGHDQRVHPEGLILHQCTYVKPEDFIESRKRHHTHLRDVVLRHKHILTHISQKVTPRVLETKYPLGQGGTWAYDGLKFHNKIW